MRDTFLALKTFVYAFAVVDSLTSLWILTVSLLELYMLLSKEKLLKFSFPFSNLTICCETYTQCLLPQNSDHVLILGSVTFTFLELCPLCIIYVPYGHIHHKFISYTFYAWNGWCSWKIQLVFQPMNSLNSIYQEVTTLWKLGKLVSFQG